MHQLSWGEASFAASLPVPTQQQRFALAEWGHEFVVFDGATGACHLLSEAAGSVFAGLLSSATGPMSVRQIFEATAGVSVDPVLEDEHQALITLLSGLCEVGLVQKVAS